MGGRPGAVVWRTNRDHAVHARIAIGRGAQPGAYRQATHAVADDERGLTGGFGDAAYGGIYIAASLAWLWAIEGRVPDRWDTLGAAICVAGALVILYAPHPT